MIYARVRFFRRGLFNINRAYTSEFLNMAFITVAIHTYEKAVRLRNRLEKEGIEVEFANVNLTLPGLTSGVRIRIKEEDLALALRIIENPELFEASTPEVDPHNFLVPVDLSERSFMSVRHAARIATSNDGRITLLYSYIDPYVTSKIQLRDTLTYDSGDKNARAGMRKNAEMLLRNFVERVQNAMKSGSIPPVSLAYEVAEGVPEDAISEYSRTHVPKLIVMGTRTSARKEHDMIGSVTAEVLEEGYTVLSIPENLGDSDFTPREVLFFSGLDQNDILAMDALYRFFGSHMMHVTILPVPRPRRFFDSAPGKATQHLCNYCMDHFPNFTFDNIPVSAEESENRFKELQQQHSFDLIVIPNKRRNSFNRLFNSGLAHNLLFHSDIPMLTIPV